MADHPLTASGTGLNQASKHTPALSPKIFQLLPDIFCLLSLAKALP